MQVISERPYRSGQEGRASHKDQGGYEGQEGHEDQGSMKVEKRLPDWWNEVMASGAAGGPVDQGSAE